MYCTNNTANYIFPLETSQNFRNCSFWSFWWISLYCWNFICLR